MVFFYILGEKMDLLKKKVPKTLTVIQKSMIQ